MFTHSVAAVRLRFHRDSGARKTVYQRGLNSSTIRQKVSMCGEMDIWFGLVLVVCVRDVTHTHEHDLGHARTHALFWEVLDQAAADSHQVFSTIIPANSC